LKVLQNRLSTICDCENVIGVKFDVQMSGRAATANKTAEMVTHEYLEPKAGAHFPAIF
jgi:hypothetical protein